MAIANHAHSLKHRKRSFLCYVLFNGIQSISPGLVNELTYELFLVFQKVQMESDH